MRSPAILLPPWPTAAAACRFSRHVKVRSGLPDLTASRTHVCALFSMARTCPVIVDALRFGFLMAPHVCHWNPLTEIQIRVWLIPLLAGKNGSCIFKGS